MADDGRRSGRGELRSVTASEFAFLALGLVLGAATGAALIEVLRAKAPGRHEIRVTVAPNSIPARRAATLSDSPTADEPAGPARGGPADRRWVDRPIGTPSDDDPAADDALAAGADRTIVRSGGGEAPFQLTPSPARGGSLGGERAALVGIAIAREPDPQLESILTAASGRTGSKRVAAAVGAGATAAGATAAVANAGPRGQSGPATGTTGASTAGGRSADTDDACAEQRRIAEERCAVSARARDGAREALEALRTAQRTYDDHASRAEEEAATADPRAVRAAKEAAQQAFRQARGAATTRDAIEAAAREWLGEINRINNGTREAAQKAERHRAAAAELAPRLERLAVEADAARISAETAEEACVAAREAVAVCQEDAARIAAGLATPEPRSTAGAEAGAALAFMEDDGSSLAAPMASRAGEDAAIIRLLRGDRDVMTRIAAELGGGDEAERRRWQLAIAGLLEALIARTIEASAFDYPSDHPFWGMFGRAQCRDISAALASLGYRHDGFGAWADERVPSQRDLSLAVGYAGLDPMRIRTWPSEAEMNDLLRDVTVAADEYVWEAAGSLSLGELISLLGLRADPLTELWNDWGRIRPLLLAPA
jgi:hypothetical protein